MTVKELIAELSKYPEDLKTVVFDYAGHPYSVTSTLVKKCYENEDIDVFEFMGIKIGEPYLTIGTDM